MRRLFPLTSVVLLSMASGMTALGRDYARPDLLLEPAELAKPETAEKFVVLDVRAEVDYDRGHIPRAIRIDHDAWKAAFGEGQDTDGWSKRIGQLGIGPDAKVVVYDGQAMKNAGRIWWILTYWGIDEVRLLNGGWLGWNAAGFPTSEESPAPAALVEFLAEPQSERLATMDQILGLLDGDKLQVVDSRTADEFRGVNRQRNQRAGSIPGAKNLEWSDLIDQQTHRFKNPQQLRQLFDRAGIDLDRPTASYCQSGGRASCMAFGLELMGASEVRNYYQSWNEWGNSDHTPVVTPVGNE